MKTESKKIFIDTNVFIYLVNKTPEYYEKIKNMLESEYNASSLFYTSTITKAEFLVKPLTENNRRAIICFNEILKDLQFDINNIDSSIATEAAYIRSKYKKTKLADSLQLASAIVNGCNYFMTNDKGLEIASQTKFIFI